MGATFDAVGAFFGQGDGEILVDLGFERLGAFGVMLSMVAALWLGWVGMKRT